MQTLDLHVRLDRETDGRWIAEIPELRGCLAYGEDEGAAVRAVGILAFEIVADEISHGERELAAVRFVLPQEAA